MGSDGFRTMRRSDAHAWVEVWFPGVGWVTSDPTPAAEVSTTWWQRVKNRIEALLHDPWAWALTALALVLVTAVVLVVRRRRSRAAGSTDPAAQTIDPDLAAAFARLEADLLAEGRPRAPNETVAALARRLNRSSLNESGSSNRTQPVSPARTESGSSDGTASVAPNQIQSGSSDQIESDQIEWALPTLSEPVTPPLDRPGSAVPRPAVPRPETPRATEPLRREPEQAKYEADPPPETALMQAFKVLERALYAPRPPSRQECLAAATAISQHGEAVADRPR